MYSLSLPKGRDLWVIMVWLGVVWGFGFLFYEIIPPYVNHAFFQKKAPPTLYLLRPQATIEFMRDRGYDVEAYEKRLALLRQMFSRYYAIQTIDEKKIATLPEDAIVLAFDNFNISKASKEALLAFLRRGGSLIFNYHFAYFVDGRHEGARLVQAITGLEPLHEVKKEQDLFITPNLMAPYQLDKSRMERFDYILYDAIPLFRSRQIPDAVMTNWSATSTPYLNNRRLPLHEAGVIWHGHYQKGRWVYLAFPSYSLTDTSGKFFEQYLLGAVAYLQSDVRIVKYPYLQYSRVVFISEDTEYRYENLARFAALSQEYHIPVTAFCVASLAQKYIALTQEQARNPYVEIGSHSLSHKKIIGTGQKNIVRESLGSKLILDKIIGYPIEGFRPPREEIDDQLAVALRDANYSYVMEKIKAYFYPKEEFKGLLTIPRHGTDDYTYLINLDWDREKIINNIIYESNLLTSLHLLYTLSVHTHLLTYSSNIEILKAYYDDLKKNPSIQPLNGRQIARLVRLNQKIDLSYHRTGSKVIIQIHNQNDDPIEGFAFRIYFGKVTTIKHIISEIIGVDVKEIARTDDYVDVRVSLLRPRSILSLIADYR